MDKFEEVVKSLGKMGYRLNTHYGNAAGQDVWACRIVLPEGHKHAPSPPWGMGATMLDALLEAVRDLHSRT